ncbi:hypothetical protein [Rubritalea sp.]|uniref:hypothetical protein n=1 Tax=Rubritalea sp. TaxID=2109375 RepID=UPI003EF9CCC0
MILQTLAQSAVSPVETASLWLDVTLKIIPAAITLFVGIAALRFQKQQAEINRYRSDMHAADNQRIMEYQTEIAADKLRLDLFEKRFEVQKLIDELQYELETLSVPSDKARKLFTDIQHRSQFLFGEDLKNHLQAGQKQFFKWRNVNENIQALPDHRRLGDLWNELQSENQDFELYFTGASDSFFIKLRQIMKKYIGFNCP